MCGIVGLLVKRDELRGRLGQLVTPMLDCMGTRGPDSAGLAVFHEPLEGPQRRFGLFTAQVGFDWQLFHTEFSCSTGSEGSIRSVESHAWRFRQSHWKLSKPGSAKPIPMCI